MSTTVEHIRGTRLMMYPGAGGNLGSVCADAAGSALLLADTTLTTSTPHATNAVSSLRGAGVDARVLALPDEQTGTLQGARQVQARLRETEADICVALGGGSTIDTAKLAVAARAEPWLLDRAILQRPTGFLRSSRSGERADHPGLVAVSTLPGSAAEVSPKAIVAPDHAVPRRLINGEVLRPPVAIVDPDFADTLPESRWSFSLCEILFRVLGPFLCTGRSTGAVDRAAADLIVELLTLGTSREGSRPQRRRITELSVRTATGEHIDLWRPAMPAWWCIQNTVTTYTGLSKGELTARALPTLLRKVEEGAASLGTRARLKRLERLAGPGVLESIEASCAQALTAVPRSLPTRSDDELQAWCMETQSLWGHHPGVASLGTEGARNLLREIGM